MLFRAQKFKKVSAKTLEFRVSRLPRFPGMDTIGDLKIHVPSSITAALQMYQRSLEHHSDHLAKPDTVFLPRVLQDPNGCACGVSELSPS